MGFVRSPSCSPMWSARESRSPVRGGWLAVAVLLLVTAPLRVSADVPPSHAVNPGGILWLADALSAALEGSPTLASSSWESRVAEAREVQAALRPNPEVWFEVEDVGGRGELAGVSASQTTLQFGELIELGDKRDARIRVSRLGREVARSDFEAVRLDLLAETTQAFVAVLAAQEVARLAGESAALSAELRDAAERRLRAGIAPSVEVSRAAILQSNAELALEQARGKLGAARQALAASWGAEEARFERVEGDLEHVGAPPGLDTLRAALEANPDLARWRSERAHRQAAVELERSRAIPDVVVAPGVRYLAGADSTSFLVSAVVPLPLFGRNQGGIAEASSRLSQVGEEERASRVRASRELASEYQTLVLARARALGYRTEIAPTSAAALDQVRRGYLEGRFNQIEVIDAQRTLFAVRAEYVDALATYHRSVAAIERLIAAPLQLAP